MISERGTQLAINGNLTNDNIRPWPIDIHDDLAGSRTDQHEADVYLGTDDLRVYVSTPEQGDLTRADHERLLALLDPIDADFSRDHAHNAVMFRVVVPLTGTSRTVTRVTPTQGPSVLYAAYRG